MHTASKVLSFFLLLVVILSPIERRLPAKPGQKMFRTGWLQDLLHFSLNPFLLNAGSALVLSLLAASATLLVPVYVPDVVAQQHWSLQLAEIFILSELFSYWAHRLFHEIPALWKFHEVHHSAEEMDWLVAHRQHPLEALVMIGAANIPVYALGFPIKAFLGFVLLQKIYTAFIHSNVNIGFGRLSPLLASPQFHHWHHARNKTAYNKNYSATLPWLDIIFGSYYLPLEQFPASYGLPERISPSYLGQLAHPFIRLFKPLAGFKVKKLSNRPTQEMVSNL